MLPMSLDLFVTHVPERSPARGSTIHRSLLPVPHTLRTLALRSASAPAHSLQRTDHSPSLQRPAYSLLHRSPLPAPRSPHTAYRSPYVHPPPQRTVCSEQITVPAYGSQRTVCCTAPRSPLLTNHTPLTAHGLSKPRQLNPLHEVPLCEEEQHHDWDHGRHRCRHLKRPVGDEQPVE